MLLQPQRIEQSDDAQGARLDWANEAKMLADAPRSKAFLKTMYRRPNCSADHRPGAGGAERPGEPLRRATRCVR